MPAPQGAATCSFIHSGKMRYPDLCSVPDSTVSVVTPSRNRAQFLRATIEPLAAQTFRNFEHRVADGKSSDGMVGISRNILISTGYPSPTTGKSFPPKPRTNFFPNVNA